MQFVQGRGHGESQIVQPRLIDHGELRHTENGVALFPADTQGSHLLAGRQAINLSVHGNGCPDLGMLLEDCAQVRHGLRSNIGSQIDKGAGLAVAHQIVVAETAGLEGVDRSFAGGIAADAGTDHFTQAVGPGVPGDFDTGFFLHIEQYRIIVITGGKSRNTAQHNEFRLAFRRGYGSQGQDHHHGQKNGDELFHGETSFVFDVFICCALRARLTFNSTGHQALLEIFLYKGIGNQHRRSRDDDGSELDHFRHFIQFRVAAADHAGL